MIKKETIFKTILKDIILIFDFIKKIPLFLVCNFFISIILIFIISLFLSGFIFYKYDYLKNREQPQNIKKEIIFNKKNYEKILDLWNNQEHIYNNYRQEDIKNFFR